MNILKPFLWYRHITRGVYYDTAENMKDKNTGEPDKITAFMFTSMVYCSGHIVFAYGLFVFNFEMTELHDFLKGVIFFGTHKGPFNLLVLLNFVLGFFICWVCCRYDTNYDVIAREFNYEKPGHLFAWVATLTMPVVGFILLMYAVSQEHKRYGLNQIPRIEFQQTDQHRLSMDLPVRVLFLRGELS
jgi:hypothetical protein